MVVSCEKAMDPPPQRPRRVCLPGKRCDPKSHEFKNRSLFLTYEGVHIPKREYREWFAKVVMPNYCKNGKLNRLEVAHETSDTYHNQIHTHVVFQTTEPIRTRDTNALSWKALPSTPCNERTSLLAPTFQILDCATEIGLALYIIGIEDKACIHLRQQYAPYEHIMKTRLQARRRDVMVGRAMYLDQRPEYKLKHMQFWQRDVVNLIKNSEEKTPCDINFVATASQSGRSTLVRAIKHSAGSDVHIIQGICSKDDISKTLCIPLEVWTRRTLILNIGTITKRSLAAEAISSVIIVATNMACHNLWIFCSKYPKQALEDPTRWNTYKVTGYWDIDGTADYLEKISIDCIAQRIGANPD